MKKSFKKIFLVLITVFITTFATALNASAVGREYRVTNIGTDRSVSQNLPVSEYIVRNASNGTTAGYGYCMAPGKTAATTLAGDYYYGTTRELSPESNKYDLALAYAYQILVSKGYIATGKKPYMAYVSTLFRLVSDYYGQLDRGYNEGHYGQVKPYLVEPVYDEKTKTYSANVINSNLWDTSTAKSVISDFKEVISHIPNNTPASKLPELYKKLLQADKVSEPKWTFKLVDEKELSENKVKLTIEVTLDSGFQDNQVNWNDFKIESCKHGYVCTGFSIKKLKTRKAQIQVTVDTTKGNEQAAAKDGAAYGITLKTSIKSIKYVNGRIKFIEPTAGTASLQKMILVNTDDKSSDITIPLDLKDKKCECEVDENAKYTGNYIYTRIAGGKIQTTKFPITDTEKAKKLNCPETCEEPQAPPSCTKKDGQYYGKAELHPDGQPVDEATYRRECLHSCQKPSGSDNNYYCKESEPGKGDGKVCDEDQYNTECLCPNLKTTCDNNPSAPECQEYDEKCTNCNPTISLPQDCNDFDIESEFTGIVSDINQIESKCNPKVNQVKKCVINKTDLADHSFEATSIDALKDNPYCKVWCKETYKFTVPTAQYSKSGGYFTLQSTINGQRDCYISGGEADTVSPINAEAFNGDLETAKESLSTAYNAYLEEKSKAVEGETAEEKASRIAESKQAVTEASAKIEKIINQYNACTTGWNNEMKFEPKLEFKYDEDYMNMMNGEFKEKDGSKTSSSTDIYCTGDTDKEYNCTSGKITDVNSDSLYRTETISKFDSESDSLKTETVKISKAQWIQKTVVNEAIYQPSDQFSTFTQYGTIKLKYEKCDGHDCLWTRLPDASLPVQLKTGAGVFPFTFTFKDIGQSNSDNSLGRLIGKDDSILVKFAELDEAKKCSYQENNKDIATSVKGGYVCHYLNDCDDCTFECVGDNCTFTDETPKCKEQDGKYYDENGNETTKEEYEKSCDSNNNKCKIKNNKYYDANGNETTSDKYIAECGNKCIIKDNKYYDNTGQEVNEETYKQRCDIKCTDCNLVCDDNGNCHFEDDEPEPTPSTTPACENGNCNVKCDTCIFDGKQETYKFKSVSLNNLFPNSCSDSNASDCRNEGYNWNSTTKATVTKKEIAENGENIYNEPEYSYTITSEQQQNIRNLNKQVGSYSNSTLPDGTPAIVCDNITYNEIEYSVRCTSSFLSQNNGKYFTENKRNNEFKLWTDTEYCSGGSCLSRKDGIGPSWK